MLDFYPDLEHSETLDPYKFCEEVAKTGYEWAEADASASLLEETKKTFLAKLTAEYMDASRLSANGKGISKLEAESRALSDPRYDTHLELMVDARKQASMLRVKYETGKMYIDLSRSVHATRRAEMTMR